MAAYRRVYGFGHLRADCRRPAGISSGTYTLVSGMGLPFPYSVTEMIFVQIVSQISQSQQLFLGGLVYYSGS